MMSARHATNSVSNLLTSSGVHFSNANRNLRLDNSMWKKEITSWRAGRGMPCHAHANNPTSSSTHSPYKTCNRRAKQENARHTKQELNPRWTTHLLYYITTRHSTINQFPLPSPKATMLVRLPENNLISRNHKRYYRVCDSVVSKDQPTHSSSWILVPFSSIVLLR